MCQDVLWRAKRGCCGGLVLVQKIACAMMTTLGGMLACAACSDADRSDTLDAHQDADAEAAEPTLEQALSENAHALCARAAECLPLVVGAQFGGDVAACAARELATLTPVLHAPGFAATTADLDALTAFFDAADCDAIRRFVLGFSPPPTLELAGTLDDGAPCVHPYQCRSGACHRRLDEPCGTCGEHLGEGAACTSFLQCEYGAACASDACVAYAEPGEACDGAHPCWPHDVCLAGTCASALGKDAACTSLIGQCDLQGALLVCDPATHGCQPVEWVTAGADCGVREGHNLVCADSECIPSPLFGTCMAHAADGAACDPANGPICAFHATCIDGTCHPDFSATCGSP